MEETKKDRNISYLDTLRAEKLVDGKDILFGNVRLSRRIDVSYLCLRIGCPLVQTCSRVMCEVWVKSSNFRGL
jgi:hypothetical protein